MNDQHLSAAESTDNSQELPTVVVPRVDTQSPAPQPQVSAVDKVSAEVKLSLPGDRLAGLKENWKTDIVSGFILFLIALPLSLGIARASGVPPMAGLIAAIVGGMLVSQASGSFVTINGPAAGLIVVIVGTVDRLGGGDVGYHCALAAIVISGVALLLLGLLKAGKFGDFFPSSVVHGMLAAIGLIIMIKELPDFLGVKSPAKEPFVLLANVPFMVQNMNPEIATIGLVSLVILIVYNMIQHGFIKKIPAPIIVVTVALILGAVFDLDDKHPYSLCGHMYTIDPAKCLVVLPTNIASGITFPDFSKWASGAFWFSVLSITLIQGLETMLSAAAVDKLDPFKRKCNLSKDVSAVGLGSVVSGAIGGLPMIAEIVRSTANVMAGARTRWSNFFHGTFILLFLIFGAQLIDRIPLSSLAALLIVTGFKLTSPAVWKKTYHIGVEQVAIFGITVVATLATDLLIGVTVGIATKFIIHLFNGAPITALFKAKVDRVDDGDQVTLRIGPAAIFSNFLSVKPSLDALAPGKIVTIDLSSARLVDHTFMERLHDFQNAYTDAGGRVELQGLGKHKASSSHHLAARRLTQH